MSELESYLEAYGAKPGSGSEWQMDCPFCGKSSHLYVNSEPREDPYRGGELPAGRWICFRCSKKGLHFADVMAEIEGITFAEARSIIGGWSYSGINWRRDMFKNLRRDGKNNALLDWLPPEFESVRDVWPVYLNERGVPKPLAKRLGLGVCRSGEYKDRLIIPISCPGGRSFTARTLLKSERLRYKGGPGSGRLLFGYQSVDWWKGPIVIVEGAFDAMRVLQSYLPCVALMGKQIREHQLEMLRPLAARRFVIMLDNDALRDAADVANKLWGRATVATALETDPGDSSPEEIANSVATSVSAEVAYSMSLRSRIDKTLKKL